MDKNEFHVLIKYCFLKGKIQLKQNLDLMPDTAPGKSSIKDCGCWKRTDRESSAAPSRHLVCVFVRTLGVLSQFKR
ncbi:hypothetical protein GWI33_019313 [Rhynchophorus ferrugineus]|uniref:Uncharacterized protein n=1 Tax=Rhynchophorus ferrugineus TaxID=354439 RepID=A0A834M5F6_RHYFE|nr:hypothetical protein GWI33_019313 [Rhynchophorus ferrugineus]